MTESRWPQATVFYVDAISDTHADVIGIIEKLYYISFCG
jgi:hypothetical protein